MNEQAKPEGNPTNLNSENTNQTSAQKPSISKLQNNAQTVDISNLNEHSVADPKSGGAAGSRLSFVEN